MTTKIQPTNIDQTLNYSMNQVLANTVLVNGTDLLVYANAAFLQANTAASSINGGSF
jgi:hypothetical protein